ncbi:MAG: phosphotransferase [Desulfuromonadales bacterium]|nr:phosphotransferase [Desulfuromonadales bacterium]
MSQAPCSAALVTVAKFWTEDYPSLSARDKRMLIRRYALFLSEIIQAEPDLALPLPSDCCLTENQNGVTFACTVGLGRIRANQQPLSTLLAWFWLTSSRSERFRFLLVFGGPDKSLRSWDLAEIEKRALITLQEIWKRKVSEVHRGGAGFRVERQSGFRIWRRDDTTTASVLVDMMPDPDQAFEGARICKPGSRNHTGQVELAGGCYLLKRYNCRGWIYRFQNSMRPSRAVKNWDLMHHFLVRGIPVPDPYLCLEERCCRLLGRSYILMKFFSGETLRQLWPKLDERGCIDLVASLANLLGRMHRFGLLHGDLKWDNIMVQRDSRSMYIQLIDFDGARQVSYPTRKKADHDLRRFLYDLRGNDPTGLWESRFMRGWSTWLAHL